MSSVTAGLSAMLPRPGPAATNFLEEMAVGLLFGVGNFEPVELGELGLLRLGVLAPVLAEA